MRHTFAVLAAALLILAAGPASAGLVDTPLPELQQGKKTLHLYSVVGVISQSNTGTFFSCTSTAPTPARIGVQVFLKDGGLFTTNQRDIAPGATVTFGTLGGNQIFGVTENINVGLDQPTSARIVSTSKSMICTAFVFDSFTLTMNHLTIVAKTKQKAEN